MKKLNEIKRLQQLAGINEIKVNPPSRYDKLIPDYLIKQHEGIGGLNRSIIGGIQLDIKSRLNQDFAPPHINDFSSKLKEFLDFLTKYNKPYKYDKYYTFALEDGNIILYWNYNNHPNHEYIEHDFGEDDGLDD